MKSLFIVLLLIAGINCQGQLGFIKLSDSTAMIPTRFYIDSLMYQGKLGYDTIGFDQIGYDSLVAICKERGHVKGDTYSSTLMYCEPYVIDTDSTSVMVYPACNWNTYNCIRCGKTFTEQEKETRKVIWKKVNK